MSLYLWLFDVSVIAAGLTLGLFLGSLVGTYLQGRADKVYAIKQKAQQEDFLKQFRDQVQLSALSQPSLDADEDDLPLKLN